MATTMATTIMATTKKIFIIDDEASFLDIFTRFLTREGFSVFAFSDQKEALLEAPEKKPDAVLLDVNMPGMSGLDVFKYLKRDEIGLSPKIFFPTSMTQDASGNTLDDAYAQRIGADGYINKGEEIALIVQKLKKALSEPAG